MTNREAQQKILARLKTCTIRMEDMDEQTLLLDNSSNLPFMPQVGDEFLLRGYWYKAVKRSYVGTANVLTFQMCRV